MKKFAEYARKYFPKNPAHHETIIIRDITDFIDEAKLLEIAMEQLGSL